MVAYSWLMACSESGDVTLRKQKHFNSVEGSRIRGFPNTYSAATSSWILSKSNFGTCHIEYKVMIFRLEVEGKATSS